MALPLPLSESPWLKSLRGRMTILLLSFVTAILAATLVAVFLTTAANVREQASDDLEVGARVFQELLASRDQQLAGTAQVLADDFAFREAVASEDRATIRSALLNHGGRIDADLMVLADQDGELLATALRTPDDELQELDEEQIRGRLDQGVVSLDGIAYQLVTATVRAPLPVANVVMGFRLDDRLADDLRSLTGLHVSFLSPGDEAILYSSTLPAEAREALATQAAAADPLPQDSVHSLSLDAEDYLSLLFPLNEAEEGPSVLLQTSMAEAFAPFRPLWYQLALIALLAFALSLILAGFLAAYVTRPVSELANTAARISEGDYSRSAPVPPIGELARLGKAFNAMQEGIREREQHILHQAYHDPLTGLPNRALASDRLKQGIERAKRDGHVLGVVVLDVNRFKEINDSLGHPTGDAVLKEIANRLSARLRSTDTVARLGGDEFLVLVDADDESGPEALAKDLIDDVCGTEVCHGDVRLQLAVSLGVALCPRDGEEPDTLMRRADIAMYEAKEKRVPLSVYASGRDEAHLRRLQMVADLRTAIDEEQFHLQYQPKITVLNRQPAQMEALLRWNHPEKGLISPEEFIPLAEHSGYIRLISRWVLRNVVAQVADWRAQGHDISVAVNISALDLVDSALPEFLSDILAKHQLGPDALGIEITETTVMQDAQHAMAILHAIRELGVCIAIDDFGTGYSSLAQLRSLPVDELKIDKSFVMRLAGQAEDDEDPVIVRSTIELAHNMGLRVVAEGVEDEETWWRLAAYGCDYIQGFWISRPISPNALPDWLGEFSHRPWRKPTQD